MEQNFFENILFLSLKQKFDVKNWHAGDLFDLSSSSFLWSNWLTTAKDS